MRDTVGALMFKLRGASDGTTDEIRDRVLGFVKGKRQDDLVRLNERVLPTLLGKIRPEARRLLDLHRHGGRATYIVSAAPHEIVEPLAHVARHDGRHRHPWAGRRRDVHRRARRPVLLRRRQGRGDPRAGQVGGLRPRASATPTATRPATCRCCRPSVTRSSSTPTAELERHARRHGWPIVHFSQRTKAVIRRTAAGVATTAIGGAAFVAGARARPPRGGRFTAAGSGRAWSERQLARLCATSAPRESHISPSSSNEAALDEPAPVDGTAAARATARLARARSARGSAPTRPAPGSC